ncbi:hypothetical protein [Rhizobium laguerreae]|uniref:hypothetical protein n=1 Tax=Rhizobium laguerreae TaxID=1076926 RepID=UPI0014412A45|nr:hypothetical protein [Rhizobium laguerreae]MBY3053456.1 hypothetical protein [Rhizobium laguerreae]MBY3344204.1 hypothetical protein [Rhizobium laguerreae]MBY3350810.1 hypothetical protein [Rhizobium laguerreae]MBY3372342.1 hypothetical protein [Rhizobium laguerreae]MBY3431134.1 hypothetical protein [Rhizobium laguerreae]
MAQTFLSHAKLRNRIKGLVDSNTDKAWLKRDSNAHKIRFGFVANSFKILMHATTLSPAKRLRCRPAVKDFR